MPQNRNNAGAPNAGGSVTSAGASNDARLVGLGVEEGSENFKEFAKLLIQQLEKTLTSMYTDIRKEQKEQLQIALNNIANDNSGQQFVKQNYKDPKKLQQAAQDLVNIVKPAFSLNQQNQVDQNIVNKQTKEVLQKNNILKPR